jgi:hypothetical protein
MARNYIDATGTQRPFSDVARNFLLQAAEEAVVAWVFAALRAHDQGEPLKVARALVELIRAYLVLIDLHTDPED